MDYEYRHDLLVQSRFRNLILWEAMGGRSSAEVSREIGVSPTEFGKLLNLKASPFEKICSTEERIYRKPVLLIAKHFRMLPEDMFPESLYALELPDKVERRYSSGQLLPLFAAARMPALLGAPEEEAEKIELRRALEDKLQTLKPREECILRLRSGLVNGREYTLEEVAKEFNLSCERIRHIEAKALRKLRHPSRSQDKLKYHYYEPGDFCRFCKKLLDLGECKNPSCPSKVAEQLTKEAREKHNEEIKKLKLAVSAKREQAYKCNK